MITACATQKNVLYLQNNVALEQYQTASDGQIRLRPDDMISIVVSSINSELASVFNMQSATSITPSGSYVGLSSGSNSTQNRVLAYTVDPNGQIDYPVLGKLQVEGLTRFELSEMIKDKIIESEMILDPIVTIEFGNLSYSTLGDVTSPGNYAIVKDQITILEALSTSKDLAITALRDRVFVLRRVDDKIVTYQLDLRSTDIYTSPAFYIQQNDVIYVEPNKKSSNQSTINGNTVLSASFWMSLASFMLTIIVLLV